MLQGAEPGTLQENRIGYNYSYSKPKKEKKKHRHTVGLKLYC